MGPLPLDRGGRLRARAAGDRGLARDRSHELLVIRRSGTKRHRSAPFPCARGPAASPARLDGCREADLGKCGTAGPARRAWRQRRVPASHQMTRLVFVTVVARLLLAGAYIWVSGYVIKRVVERARPPAPTATQDLKAGHELAQGDLETEEIKTLVTRYLRKDVDKGLPITADMVSPKQLPPPVAPTIAAVVTMPQHLLRRRNIVEDSPVEIHLANSPLRLPGKVAKLICHELPCSVIVSLAKTPPTAIGPADFSTADIVLELPPAPPPPPAAGPP